MYFVKTNSLILREIVHSYHLFLVILWKHNIIWF